jgi:chemotaxis protein CheC
LIDQEVVLSVPTIIFETREELATRLGQSNTVISVSQEMDGPFAMNSLLVFSPEDSLDVVREMLEDHLSDESITELQSEALSEIGNIVLNAVLV